MMEVLDAPEQVSTDFIIFFFFFFNKWEFMRWEHSGALGLT